MPSRLHSKRVAVASPTKVKVAVRSVVGLVGLPVMVASGCTALTVQVYSAGVRSGRPRLLMARTRKVWLPLLRSV